MPANQFKFTRRSIDAIKHESVRVQYRDTEHKGLALIVQPAPSTKKTFYKRRSVGGRDEKIRLGDYDKTVFGPDEARKAAAEFDVQINRGENVAAARRALKEEPSFRDLFDEYLKIHLTKAGKPLGERTKAEYRMVAERYLDRIMGLKPSQIDGGVSKSVLVPIKARASKVKAATIISMVLNSWKPGLGEGVYREVKGHLPKLDHRERFLSDEETGRFVDACAANPYGDFFMMLLLTGQRKSNVLSMKWADIDLTASTWRISGTEMKNGLTLTVGLAPEAMAILGKLNEKKTLKAKFVFPGSGKAGHISDPRAAWESVLKAAKIENFRIHDLRHTLASWLINGGHSVDVVGKALGHKSNAASKIYAHLTQDTVENAVSGVIATKIGGR